MGGKKKWNEKGEEKGNPPIWENREMGEVLRYITADRRPTKE